MGPAGPGGMPAMGGDTAHAVFITNFMNKDTFESGFALSNDITSDYVIVRNKKTGKLERVKSKDVLDNCKLETYKYIGDGIASILKEVYHKYKTGQYVDYQYLPCLVTEFTEILTDDQLEYSELLEQVNWEQIHEDFNSGLATLQFQSQAILENTKPVVFNVLEPVKYEYVKKLLREYTDLTVLQSLNGKYFAYNKLSCKRTKGVQSVYEITDSMLQSIANKE